jgi:hypothetical protein
MDDVVRPNKGNSEAKVYWLQFHEKQTACGHSQAKGKGTACPVSPKGVRE